MHFLRWLWEVLSWGWETDFVGSVGRVFTAGFLVLYSAYSAYIVYAKGKILGVLAGIIFFFLLCWIRYVIIRVAAGREDRISPSFIGPVNAFSFIFPGLFLCFLILLFRK